MLALRGSWQPGSSLRGGFSKAIASPPHIFAINSIMIPRILTLAAVAAISNSASGQVTTFAEGFDSGSNQGGWQWGTGNEAISPLNGHPGAYLKDLTLSTCCPSLDTTFGQSSIFTGDLAAKGVTSIGVDLITLHTDLPVTGRPLTLVLWNDGGTPFNFTDDWGAYNVGAKDIPDSGVPIFTPAGWADFNFQVDAQSSTTPPGWKLFGQGSKGWKDLMADVDAVEFYYGVPGTIYLFLSWDVGMDNPRISFADCDGNGVPDSDDLAAGALDLDGNGVLDTCQLLSADTATVSASTGGSQTFSLHAGSAHAGEAYFLAGSLSGSTPGFLFGGVTVPLNLDSYTLTTVISPNQPPLANSFGILDAAGQATASFTLGLGHASLVGLNLQHAFVTLDPVSSGPSNVSNAIPLTIVL